MADVVDGSDPDALTAWLLTHYAPSGAGQLDAWRARVRREISPAALPALAELITTGSDEERYQAVAVARTLGAQVWATDDAATVFEVRL